MFFGISVPTPTIASLNAIRKWVLFTMPDGTVVKRNVRVEFRELPGRDDFVALGQVQTYLPNAVELAQMVDRVKRGLDPGTLVYYPVSSNSS